MKDHVAVHKDVVPNLCTCVKILIELVFKPRLTDEDLTRIKYVNKVMEDTYNEMNKAI